MWTINVLSSRGSEADVACLPVRQGDLLVQLTEEILRLWPQDDKKTKKI